MSRHQSAFSLSEACRMGSSILTMSDFSDVINGEMKRDSTSCALIAAMLSGEQDLAVLALKHGDNINHRNRQGQTALHVALEHGREDMCLWLLSRGADPYISDSAGRDCSGWAEDAMGLTSAQKVCLSPACMLFCSCAEWVCFILVRTNALRRLLVVLILLCLSSAFGRGASRKRQYVFKGLFCVLLHCKQRVGEKTLSPCAESLPLSACLLHG